MRSLILPWHIRCSVHDGRSNPKEVSHDRDDKRKGNEAHPGGTRRRRGLWLCSVALLVILLSTGQAWAAIETSEVGLFTAVAPDAMIVLDLSGSMKWNPPGDHDSWNNPTNSTATPPARVPSTTIRACRATRPYCSRFEIARKTLFSILDDNRDGTVNANDETSMNIRFGLGKFQGSSYVKLRDIATKYSVIYCGNNTSCTVDQAAEGT